jgi:hypothetical protein
MDNGIGLGASEQAELVPIQRQVIEAELQRQQEESESGSGGQSPGGMKKNSRAGRNGMTRTETTKYINQSEQED